MTVDDSFAAWRDAMSNDRDAATSEIWQRFAARLNRLARDRLHARVTQLVSADDILQTALRSFVRNCERPSIDLNDWSSLWGLLATITIRKCIRTNQRYLGPTRDLRRQYSSSQQAEGDSSPGSLAPPSHEPTPEEAACLADLVERLLSEVGERERRIIGLRLEGYSIAEIPELASTSERTTERALKHAREILERLSRDDD